MGDQVKWRAALLTLQAGIGASIRVRHELLFVVSPVSVMFCPPRQGKQLIDYPRRRWSCPSPGLQFPRAPRHHEEGASAVCAIGVSAL